MAIFTEIVKVEAPAEAVQGEAVSFTVRVKNKDYWGQGLDQWVQITGAFEPPWTAIVFNPSVFKIPALQTKDFIGSFIMPGNSVTIGYGTWVPYESNGVLGDWHLEEQSQIYIALAGAPPEIPEKKIPWLPLAGIAAITLVGVILVRKK